MVGILGVVLSYGGRVSTLYADFRDAEEQLPGSDSNVAGEAEIQVVNNGTRFHVSSDEVYFISLDVLEANSEFKRHAKLVATGWTR